MTNTRTGILALLAALALAAPVCAQGARAGGKQGAPAATGSSAAPTAKAGAASKAKADPAPSVETAPKPDAAASAAPAQETAAPGGTMGRVASSAEAELNRSIDDLAKVRAQVAAEKLPMAQKLTGLEESVIELRKEADRVQRLVDAGALEIGTLKAEIKSREDELTYVSSLLDEYVRTFETKIGTAEVQLFAEPIEATKQAVENKTLTTQERFGRQTTFVGLTMKRLMDAVGGVRFAGVGVDMLGTVMNGQFAMLGPVSLFRADDGTSGVAVPQVGSANPLVRPLEGDLNSAVGALVASGEGTLPLDPSRGGALKALVAKTSIVHIFIKGGPIMWPMLVASVVALAVVLERVLFLLNEQRKRSPKTVNRFFQEVAKGNVRGAIEVANGSKDAVCRTLGYALENREASLSHALTYAETRTIKRYKRGLGVLDTVITLAPLLGLLGTVTGMMGSFAVIGGDLSSPGAITGGIAEALIATAFGLIIAIVCLIPFNYLNSRIEGVETELLAAGEQLKLLMEAKPARAPSPEPEPELALGGGL
jgi:biopolymer transport protein ExbB